MIRILLTFALCLPLLTPGIASAKKPLPPASDCVLYVWPGIPLNPGDSFNVKVIRVPSYPSAWRNPTITIEITYPSIDPDGKLIEESLTYTGGFYVNYWEAYFMVPAISNVIEPGTVMINATISEPIHKKNSKSPNYTPTFKTTRCETTTTVELPEF